MNGEYSNVSLHFLQNFSTGDLGTFWLISIEGNIPYSTIVFMVKSSGSQC